MDGIQIQCDAGTNLLMGKGVFAAGECRVAGAGSVTLGDDVVLGTGVRIEAQNGSGVRIGDHVWIGDGVSIGPRANIGRGALLTANSVVESEVPEYAVVEGAPARVTWRLR